MPAISPASLMDEIDWSDYERLVILSPHLDDAVLSCGGLLSKTRKLISQLVITICCAVPPKIQTQNKGSKPPSRKGYASPATRRKEDRLAMRQMSCDFVHLGFADAIHRRSPLTGRLIYRHNRSRWISPRVDDANYVEELYLILSRLCCELGPIVLVSPLGIGHHVDHCICAQVVKRLVKEDIRLMYYEDMPYVWDGGKVVGMPDSAEAAMERLGLTNKRQFYLHYPLREKLAAARCYESQIPALFGSNESMAAAFEAFSYEKKPVEFYWEEVPANKAQG